MDSEQRIDLLKQPKLDLGGRHKRKRLALIEQCGATKDQAAVAPLSTVLSDPNTDMEVRIQAAKALGDIGDPQGVPALSDMLKTLDNQELTHTAVLALERIGDISAAQTLVSRWESAAVVTRQWIQEALQNFVRKIKAQVFAEALAYTAPSVRMWAKENLSSPQLIPDLVSLLQTVQPKSILELQSVLAQFGTAVVAPLVADLATARGEHRQAILTTLQHIGEPAIPVLVNALGSAEGEAQAAILTALQSIGEPAISPLISALGDTQGETQAIILTVLRSMGEAAVRPLLAVAPDYPRVAEMLRTEMQDNITKALETSTPTDLPLLMNALNFADQTLLQIVQQALAAIGEPAVGNLIDLLGDERLSGFASDGLVKIGKPAVKPLLMALDTCPQSKSVLLRMENIEYALFNKGAGAKDVPWLVALLQKVDAELQQPISHALGLIGGPAVPELMRLLTSNDEETRQIAQGALKSAIRSHIYRGSASESFIPLLLQEISTQEFAIREKLIAIMLSVLKEQDDERSGFPSDSGCLKLAAHLYFMQSALLWPYSVDYIMVSMLKGSSISYEEQNCFADVHEEIRRMEDQGYGYAQADGRRMESLESTQAISNLHAIATIAPELALPHYWLGQWYYFKLKDIEKAIQAFERATQCEEYIYENRKAKSYWWLGVCYGASSPNFDYDKSLSCFQQAIELGWDNALVHQAIFLVSNSMAQSCLETGNNPGLFLIARRQSLEAARAFAARSDREDMDLEQMVHGLKRTLDQTEEQYAELGEIAGFLAVRRDFLVSQALEMAENKQINEGIALLRQVLQQNPNDLGARICLGELLLINEQVRVALEEFRQLIPKNAEMQNAVFESLMRLRVPLSSGLKQLLTRYGYAEMLAGLADFEALLSQVDRGLAQRMYSTWSLIHYDIASQLATQGQLQRATIHFQKAIDINPSNDGAWLLLGIIYHQLGDLENGMTCIVRAAKLGNRDAIGMLR